MNDSPLRILVCASTFPVRLDDGIPRFVCDLATSLQRHAHVVALAPDAPGAERQGQLGDLPVRRFTYFLPRRLQRLAPSGGRGMRENFGRSWLAKLQVLPFLVSETIALWRLVRRERIDVVNAHWLVPQGVTAAWAIGRSRRVKLVLHVHAGDVYFLKRLPLGRPIARFVVRRCDAIFAAGSHVRDTLDQLLGWPSDAVLQPMGVRQELFGDVADVQPPAEADGEFGDGFLLFVGRFVEKKGLIYLVRAMQHVVQSCPDIGLIVIGNGPEEDAVRQEIAQLGLDASVRFVGVKPHTEVVSYLRHCRLCVVPSIIDRSGETEGMPTVVTEAMTAGVPVVGSAVDGIPDVIQDCENGWLCREKDPEDLANKIVAALRSEARPQIVQSALATAENFTWQQVAKNYMECIRSVTQGEKETGEPPS